MGPAERRTTTHLCSGFFLHFLLPFLKMRVIFISGGKQCMFTCVVRFENGSETVFRNLNYGKALLRARQGNQFSPVKEVLITLEPVKQSQLNIVEKK